MPYPSPTQATAGSRPATGASRWLQGPVRDLLFGCGGAYAVYFVAACLAGPELRAVAPEGLLPLGALLLGAPHYGATLLRVYGRQEDRRAYRLFGTWASLVVALAFVVGVYDVRVGSWLLTLYLSWSPWHYSSQNYGIAVMFLRRRRIAVSERGERRLRASFRLSWILVLLSIHAEHPAANYAPVELGSSAYAFLPLGIPLEVTAVLIAIAACAYLLSAATAILAMRRAAPWRDLLPALALMGLQALWFSLPALARAAALGMEIEPLGVRYAEYTFYWIAFGHFTQYLWVTLYYSRSAGVRRSTLGYLARTFLVGSAIWGAPLLLFSPEALGVRAFDAGLGVLIASAVNIHHFILDGVIWKLRDGRIARFLLGRRDAPAMTGVGDRSGTRRGFMGLVFAVGLASAVGDVIWVWEIEFGFRRAALAEKPERLRTAARRLRGVGRAHPGLHAQIALFEARAGRLDAAIREIQRSLELQPTAEAWLLLGNLWTRKHEPERARSAYREALVIDPGYEPARRALSR